MDIYSSKFGSKEFTVAYYGGVYAFVLGELRAVLKYNQIDKRALEDIVECFDIPRYIILDVVVRIIDIAASTISMPTKCYITDDIYIKCNSYLVTPWTEIKLIGMSGDRFYNEISYLLGEFCSEVSDFEVACFKNLTPHLGVGDLDGGKSFIDKLR